MMSKNIVQFSIGAFCLCLAQCPVLAQTSIVDCANIEDADERLACYDRVSENAARLPVLSIPRSDSRETGQRPTVSNAPAPRPSANDDFGLELKRSQNEDRGPRSRIYRVLAASHNDFTGWTIEFEGGGKWKQVGTDDYSIVVGERYTVRRGTFNSYMLGNEQNNKKIRITRIE